MSNSGEHFIIKYTTKKLKYEMLNPALKRQKKLAKESMNESGFNI